MFKTLLIQESLLLFGIISFLYFVFVFSHPDKTTAHLWYLFVIAALVVFYRTKDEPITENDNVLLSPCGGKIKEIVQDGDTTKIRVFLNIHNQHAQFYPISGKVTRVEYTHGTFHPAYLLQKTKYNERTTTSIETTHGDTVKVTQIAGQLARRIVNHAKIGDEVDQGEYFGMIKFSSAVDIEFSSEVWEIKAVVGDKLTPLKTILASKK